MSNYLTNNEASGRATAKRRRKLWLASGVAGLTGVISLAAVGVAGSAGAVGLNWNTAQVSKDGDQRGDESRDWDKNEDKDKDRDKDRDKDKDHERGKEVPCDTDKLIQAIVFANSKHGGVLELAKGCTYNLTRNDYQGNGLPVITERITLKGEHTTIAREATADYFRILNVGSGGHLTIKGLTIKGGQTLELFNSVEPAAVWASYSDSEAIAAQVKAGTPLNEALSARQANPKAGLKAAPKVTAKAAPAAKGASSRRSSSTRSRPTVPASWSSRVAPPRSWSPRSS